MDPCLSVQWTGKDGDHVKSGAKFGTVKGSARSILVAERIALNFMQRMSGIATATAAMTDRLQASFSPCHKSASNHVPLLIAGPVLACNSAPVGRSAIRIVFGLHKQRQSPGTRTSYEQLSTLCTSSASAAASSTLVPCLVCLQLPKSHTKIQSGKQSDTRISVMQRNTCICLHLVDLALCILSVFPVCSSKDHFNSACCRAPQLASLRLEKQRLA